MSDPTPPRLFDADRLARHRDRASGTFSQFDFLKRRVSSALIERLEDTPRRFPTALDLGCHDGRLSVTLGASGKVSSVTACDPSPGMVARAQRKGLDACVAGLEALPFEAGTFDLVASALSLHWANDLPGTLIQIRNVLKPDGLFLGALIGGQSLTELRQCLLEAETRVTGGAAPRVSPMLDGLDAGRLLQRAGFAMPVADTDTLTIRYNTLFDLLADLKGMGETAAFASASPPLRRAVLMEAGRLYAERFSNPEGRITARVDVIWLSGWAPAPGQPQPKKPGSATVRLADALSVREQPLKPGGGDGDAD